jgi:hypothetical protein
MKKIVLIVLILSQFIIIHTISTGSQLNTINAEADQNKNTPNMNKQSDQSQKPSGTEVGDPSWGFKFIPPEGWTYQQSGDGIIMGHTTIAGIILIFPHTLQNIQEVKQEMYNGTQEEGFSLALNSDLSNKGDNILAGDYQGIMDGQQVKAHGYGTLSPYRGGAFVLAVSTPEMLGSEIIRDAEMIATNLIYSKIEVSELMIHFAAKWASFSTNTSTWIQFYPDGTYDEQYESSYSGDLSGGGNWNTYGGENVKGRWTVQGNRDSGRIVVRLANGNEMYYDYRVHEENGQKYYAEYWFNGKLYSKSHD